MPERVHPPLSPRASEAAVEVAEAAEAEAEAEVVEALRSAR
jgi:hypothetical protein